MKECHFEPNPQMQLKNALTTVVCDASRTGAGMASVALTVHKLLESRLNTHIAVGLPPEQPVHNLHLAGLKGHGFREISRNALNGVVHIHGLWTPFEWRAYREAKARGARLVISPHGSLEPWALRSKRVKKLAAWALYQKNVLQQVDLLVASSEVERDNFRKLGLTAPIAVLPVGLDTSDRPEDLSDLKVDSRNKIVLFLSRLSPKKGIPDLLEAWRRITDRQGYQLHIHGYGPDAYRSFLENRISSLGLGSDVTLGGPLFGADKWRKFQESSIYVLPSYSENFGITVAEALLSGLPVITTTATPWGELTSRGLGWIVDNDATQLRDTLNLALSMDSDRLQAIRYEANAFAGKTFLWQPIVEKYIDTYAWLLYPTAARPPWVADAA